MKWLRHIRLLLVIGGIIIAVLALPRLVFLARAPVLVLTEEPFIAVYGEARLKKERKSAERALFRRVKPVVIADGVSYDMVIYAITGASKRPKCVIFPRSQAEAAQRFHEQFPEQPAVILRGLVLAQELPAPDGFLCVYGTDREADMYRAGLCAGILGAERRNLTDQAEEQPEKQPNTTKTYVLWQDNTMQGTDREHFSRGIRESDPESNAIFVNVAVQLPDVKGIACVTLTGAGAEFLERNVPIPLILFSWVDPYVLPREVVVQFDDSVWALAAPAARMAALGQADGKIPSKPLIFSQKIAHNGVFRMLQKSAKKMP